ncbi:MAG: ATP-dependent sacrificial sulfur transferase LarE [Desulfatiglandaceae bacterium]
MESCRPENMAVNPSASKRKKAKLIQDLERLDSVLVAFSGGVDSAFLLSVARGALGEKVLGVTASSPIHSAEEKTGAIDFAKVNRIQHMVINSDEMALPEFLANGPDRCYHCKKSLANQLARVAKERGIRHMAHGANTDDLSDYRPGFKAAQAAGLMAPLIDAGLSKAEIRFLARDMGLSVWDRAADACLASRIPYGSPVTGRKLQMVETAEAFLKAKGFTQLRVRHHGVMARIESVEETFDRIIDKTLREEIVKKFRSIGFVHIAMDLEGYLSGKMNRELSHEQALF